MVDSHIRLPTASLYGQSPLGSPSSLGPSSTPGVAGRSENEFAPKRFSMPSTKAFCVIANVPNSQLRLKAQPVYQVSSAAVTLDTVADGSRKKMADGVARSPSRLCSRDGKICCYGDALSTIFLLLCLASYFSFFFSFFSYFFPASRYVYLLRVPSSVQQPSATLSKYVFYSTCSFCLCHLYPAPSRNYFVFYSFSFFFL